MNIESTTIIYKKKSYSEYLKVCARTWNNELQAGLIVEQILIMHTEKILTSDSLYLTAG